MKSLLLTLRHQYRVNNTKTLTLKNDIQIKQNISGYILLKGHAPDFGISR